MSSETPSPQIPAVESPDASTTLSHEETVADVRKRSQAIAYGAGAFLGIGIGLPIGIALRDWKIGLAVALVVGALTVFGYLKAGADHAERRAERIAREHSMSDEEMDEEEDDNGAYR